MNKNKDELYNEMMELIDKEIEKEDIRLGNKKAVKKTVNKAPTKTTKTAKVTKTTSVAKTAKTTKPTKTTKKQ